MDALAVKQACKFAKEFVLKNGPLVSFILWNSLLIRVYVSLVLTIVGMI